MTRLLTWRHAERRDRELLKRFTCAEPQGRRRSLMGTRWHPVHPKPWELEVQTGFRTLTPPAGPDTVLLLGEDGTGLAAVVLFSQMEGQGDWSSIDARGIAVATRLRGTGGAHAREALDVALTDMQGRALDHAATDQFVLARIHRLNLPSQRLCAALGFAYLDDVDEDLQYWSLTVELPSDHDRA